MSAPPLDREALEARLAARIADARRDAGRPVLVGLSAPQGAGKSTLAAALARRLGAQGVRVAVLSLDDVYLTRAERRRLAAEVHPLLAVRGPPGTHDVALANAVLDALLAGRPVTPPRFDKARDDRCDPAALAAVAGPSDVVLLEGWCVGARPQPSAALATPANALERDEDPDGVWRAFVNAALAGAYQPLFARLDLLILLLAPSFEAVGRWRTQAERTLRADPGGAGGGMTDGEVARFVQLYERLTRHVAAEAPGRADVVVRLGEAREPLSIAGA